MRELHTYIIVCIISAIILRNSAKSMHKVCIFMNGGFSPGKPPVDMQTLCRARADSADLLQTLRILSADFFLKVCSKRTLQTIEKSARFRMQTLCTLSLWGAKSAERFLLERT